ncbi:MAG: bifunctional adenosylcobinamide kinase/adenosylcobinamide-phosphate guanylyltransferase [Firmicutes bacterium HGW-Firmicutes-13]|nr:MAG: bifunctional adenosylcobinamide kinase/adenosylcobinamide-phosphate guanylyltransferase [Firmicutes bacterium HGW-Firmicutes-13]
MILVTGGARSGKSIFAENLARERGEKVVYLATAAALDSEMVERIKAHRSLRPSGWKTVEETVKLVDVFDNIPEDTEVILLDCLTFWITNMMMDKNGEGEPEGEEVKELEAFLIDEARKLSEKLKEQKHSVIVVSNELGLGLVPAYVLGRIFRDAAGKANQLIARAADEVYFMVSGLPLKLKG